MAARQDQRGHVPRECVNVLFASCTADLLERATATASSLRPELPLIVISETAPPSGAWIRYRAAESIIANLRYCRAGLAGKQIEISWVTLQRLMPHRRLQLIAFLFRSRCILALNENLDYFEVRFTSADVILRHLRWRIQEWSQQLLIRLPTLAFLRAQAAGLLIGLSKPSSFVAAGAEVFAPHERPAGFSVVIPSRNGREMLERMLPAVLEQIAGGEVIVVNNGSDDGSADFLRHNFPEIILLDHSEALVFPKAVNAGLRLARFSHICLLNNDMLIAPGFLSKLREAFDRVPDLFCAASQVFLPPGLPRQETGKTAIRETPAVSDFPVRCDPPIEGEDLSYVLYGSSGCSLYDGRRLALLGGLDEVYSPAYVDDLDVGFRAWQQGWPSVFVANAHVVHEHRVTMSRLFSKDQLDIMVLSHWLLFLARTVRQRRVFRKYWRHALVHLSSSANLEAKNVLRHIGVRGKWQARKRAVVLPDEEIIALCNGSVAVFPGTQADADRAVTLIARVTLPHPSADVTLAKQVLVTFVDQLGPVPADLREQYAEIITVQCPRHRREVRSASFSAALRQTMRKWKPTNVDLDSALTHLYATDVKLCSCSCSRNNVASCCDARDDGLRNQHISP